MAPIRTQDLQPSLGPPYTFVISSHSNLRPGRGSGRTRPRESRLLALCLSAAGTTIDQYDTPTHPTVIDDRTTKTCNTNRCRAVRVPHLGRVASCQASRDAHAVILHRPLLLFLRCNRADARRRRRAPAGSDWLAPPPGLPLGSHRHLVGVRDRVGGRGRGRGRVRVGVGVRVRAEVRARVRARPRA